MNVPSNYQDTSLVGAIQDNSNSIASEFNMGAMFIDKNTVHVVRKSQHSSELGFVEINAGCAEQVRSLSE